MPGGWAPVLIKMGNKENFLQQVPATFSVIILVAAIRLVGI
jgi:hypothetical protein